MRLPVAKLVMPSCLEGVENGRLPSNLLTGCGIGEFQMVEPAARAMRALLDAAEKRGIQVRATSTYRTYSQQAALFCSRYSVEVLPDRPTKHWQGQTWYQKPKTAVAAVPGTSNHGLGLAVDFAEERDGKPGVESVGDRFLRWLVRNAEKYGYSAELQSEPWHWRYVAGDNIPQAVLDFETQQDKRPKVDP
jgi:LAS superfamily LD-carboxypeptidase LdcB